MATGRIHGGISNQEGFTVPGPFWESPWGQAMFNGTAQLIAHPAPLVGRPQGDRRPSHNKYHVGYPGIIGGMSLLSASVVGLHAEDGYYGDFPQSEQQIVAALPPWERE